MQHDFENTIEDSGNIDFARIIRFLLMQSKLIIATVTIVFAVSLAYFFNATKQYNIVSLLQVESPNQNLIDPTNTLEVSSSSSMSDIDNLVTLYKSRTNIIKLIKDLNMHIDISGLERGDFLDIEVKPLKKLDIQLKTFFLEINEDTYKIYDTKNNISTKSYPIDQAAQIGNFQILIKNRSPSINGEFQITYRNPDNLYNTYKSKLNVTTKSSRNSWFRQEGLIEVSMITDDIIKGKNIVDGANNIFLENRIYVETEKARKAIDYIDQNIASLNIIVESNKKKLKDFREKNSTLNVDLEIQTVIQEIRSVDIALNEIEVELSNASDLYTKSNPVYLNLVNKKDILTGQKNAIYNKVRSLPSEQQDFIDLYNEVETSQILFEELQNRRLGFSILEASTIGNIRIIDQAYKSSLVSPRLFNVILLTFLSFILVCIFAVFRGFNYLPITNPAELGDNNISDPILGVFPLVNGNNFEEDYHFNASLESFIVNLQSIQDEDLSKKTITITSPSPFNGKSTLSINLSLKLASTGKKVLLIDGDLKRGKLAKSFNLRSISEEDFYAMDFQSDDKFLVSENLYFIPRVKNLLNSFQFISTKKYMDKLNKFKENFDYIVIDTAPILSVADTPIFLRKSDYAFCVVRHGINRINEIKQSKVSFAQINVPLSGFLYNAYAKPKSYYGYYGLYGNYSYQYYAEKYLDDIYEYKKNT